MNTLLVVIDVLVILFSLVLAYYVRFKILSEIVKKPIIKKYTDLLEFILELYKYIYVKRIYTIIDLKPIIYKITYKLFISKNI